MSMSDEVAGATLQISMQAGETALSVAGNVVNKTIDNIAKLLQALAAKGRESNGGKDKVSSTDLSDIKPGAVKLSELKKSAMKMGDSLVSSENGFTAEDKKILLKKAKEYGIPIAFQNEKEKDNHYATVRKSDLQVFKRMCTELMKDKLAERPKELGNFKVQPWEISHLTKELNKYDLPAQFGRTEKGEYFCLYDKSAEKTMMIARGLFIQKCKDINATIAFDRDEQGFITLKDLKSGKEISFDEIPSKEQLAVQINEKFGYNDLSKADIVCAKFGEEMLTGDDKKKFFSSEPQNEFSKIEANVQLEGENLLVKPYSCWRVTPKTDEVPKIVYRDDDGRFAILDPGKMTAAQMKEELTAAMGITDKKTLDAMVDKAVKVDDYYARQGDENYIFSKQFAKDDFDMSDPEINKNMYRTDENGNTFAKSLPVDSVDCELERTGKDSFKVNSTVQSIEKSADGTAFNHIENQTLVLSFSDKKNALKELTDMLKKQGVPESNAVQIAKECFNRAENQSAEKVILLEEIRGDKPYYGENSELQVDFKVGNKKETISFTDAEKAKNELADKFGVSEEAVAAAVDKADVLLTERQSDVLKHFGFKNVDNWTVGEASEVIEKIANNNWKIPSYINPSKYEPGSIDFKAMERGAALPGAKAPELPKIDVPVGRSR